VVIGAGSIICAQASLTTNIRVGRHVHIDRLVTIGHDAVIGDFSTLHPAVVISGDVHMGAGAVIGSNACVLEGLRLGARATVGAGAVVTRDVPQAVTVVGVPARPVDRLNATKDPS
jgi:serine acetyltransferase